MLLSKALYASTGGVCLDGAIRVSVLLQISRRSIHIPSERIEHLRQLPIRSPVLSLPLIDFPVGLIRAVLTAVPVSVKSSSVMVSARSPLSAIDISPTAGIILREDFSPLSLFESGASITLYPNTRIPFCWRTNTPGCLVPVASLVNQSQYPLKSVA
jgi:hypothetical protein